MMTDVKGRVMCGSKFFHHAGQRNKKTQNRDSARHSDIFGGFGSVNRGKRGFRGLLPMANGIPSQPDERLTLTRGGCANACADHARLFYSGLRDAAQLLPGVFRFLSWEALRSGKRLHDDFQSSA